MTVGQAIAVLIIVLFSAAVLWGRSAPGRAALQRIYGEPRPGSPRSAASTRRRSAKPASTKAPARPAATKRGRRK